MQRKKRKQNYVDSDVQGSLLRRIVAHWLVFFFVVAFSTITLQALLGDPGLPLTTRLANEAREFLLIGIIIAVLFPAFLLDTIRFSNRFVGPISRLRRQMRELGETGETPVLRFRDNDFWMELAEEFNAVRARVVAREHLSENSGGPPSEQCDEGTVEGALS